MKKLALFAGVVALSGAVGTAAYAGGVDKDGGFYATPIQKGAPRDLPGENLVPGAPLIVDTIDAVVRPIVVDPIQMAGAQLAPPTAAPAAAPAPMMRRHHHHHMMMHHHHMAMKHHMMMKHHHKMMMKKKM